MIFEIYQLLDEFFNLKKDMDLVIGQYGLVSKEPNRNNNHWFKWVPG